MKPFLKKCFKFELSKDTIVAFISGIVVIFFSSLMLFFQEQTILNEIMSIFLRDVLMILFIGFWFVLYYVIIVKKESISVLGITKKKLTLSLVLNVGFGAGLLTVFMKDGEKIVFNYGTLCAIVYIIAAGIFEMVFIYGFLRNYFERAFGIVPSIIITAAFYSLHHTGFQPEFLKLFFVGIMYISVFYITRNLFIIFPFFWGVGAIWDVLVNSTAGEALLGTTSLIVGIAIILIMVAISLYFRNKYKEQILNTNSRQSI
ncbi:hypothetical protein KQI42_16350 [Tissierella sp. MSJ-40]|uniref:CAAX prenyl protease 2/Lysostaphin resistance protein A-like domain-containing protein n=1 Tax=Tissierella simiarum TaxID=2841534 RepID=A0ABS6E9X7_9FIRM|nr:CPBP family glutamic-type intramembrane protease [Tissierella simiarum]MBU5439587.1 hypothetical protein [Tissierella simiarum]